MSKLHEVLAAEKTPTGSWNSLREDTMKKFKNPDGYFKGFSKSLAMIENTPQNEALEAQAREERQVVTTVYDTLAYALGDVWVRSEDLQYQKNATNRIATGTVMWRGNALLKEVPVDELLGLEARLADIKKLMEAAPTVDATKAWARQDGGVRGMLVCMNPEHNTKTEKRTVPVILHEATKEHPAQVEKVVNDVVVGKFTTMHRSGAATALQKSEALKRIDELIVEIKQARMRANETEVVKDKIAGKLAALLLEPWTYQTEADIK
jgi:hypothetical protein